MQAALLSVFVEEMVSIIRSFHFSHGIANLVNDNDYLILYFLNFLFRHGLLSYKVKGGRKKT